MAVRFHLDEHIPAHVAAGLRRRKIDVTTAAETGLIGASDVSQLAFAASSGRVLVTRDDDFLRLHAEGRSHADIAFCRGQSPVGEILRRLILIHDVLSEQEMMSRVEFL